jgi:hypothetical protein
MKDWDEVLAYTTQARSDKVAANCINHSANIDLAAVHANELV